LLNFFTGSTRNIGEKTVCCAADKIKYSHRSSLELIEEELDIYPTTAPSAVPEMNEVTLPNDQVYVDEEWSHTTEIPQDVEIIEAKVTFDTPEDQESSTVVIPDDVDFTTVSAVVPDEPEESNVVETEEKVVLESLPTSEPVLEEASAPEEEPVASIVENDPEPQPEIVEPHPEQPAIVDVEPEPELPPFFVQDIKLKPTPPRKPSRPTAGGSKVWACPQSEVYNKWPVFQTYPWLVSILNPKVGFIWLIKKRN